MDLSKISVQDATALFGYAAMLLGIANVGYIQQLPNKAALAQLETIVGPNNIDASRQRLSQDFINAASAKIFPTITADTLPDFDYRRLFVTNASTFEVGGLNGAQQTITFAITSAFPNSTNMYYAVPSDNGQQQVVQCNTRQWLRVSISGFVSHEPATITEILNNCYPAGSPANPWADKKAKADIYNTPKGLRDEVAQAMAPIVRNGDFPSLQTRITLPLASFGNASAMITGEAARTANVHMLINGKLLSCNSASASVNTIKLPDRRVIQDGQYDRPAREFVTLQICG